VKIKQQLTGSLVVLTVLIGLSGCNGMTRRDQNTVAGAGIGGVAGAILTNGSAIGTVGGAAVGGVIGNQIGGDRSERRHGHRGR